MNVCSHNTTRHKNNRMSGMTTTKAVNKTWRSSFEHERWGTTKKDGRQTALSDAKESTTSTSRAQNKWQVRDCLIKERSCRYPKEENLDGKKKAENSTVCNHRRNTRIVYPWRASSQRLLLSLFVLSRIYLRYSKKTMQAIVLFNLEYEGRVLIKGKQFPHLWASRGAKELMHKMQSQE